MVHVRVASISLEEIRQAVAQIHERLKSLRVEFRTFNPSEGRSAKHLEIVVAAKGESRYESLVHVVPGQPVDPGAYVNLYDGTSFNTYYSYKRRYEISRLAATPRYTWKVRGHAFFECLAWWPPGDDSEPGTLVYDRDTDTFHQVPGGLDFLNDVCERVKRISRAPPTKRRTAQARVVQMLAAVVCGAVISGLGSAWVRLRRRSPQ